MRQERAVVGWQTKMQNLRKCKICICTFNLHLHEFSLPERVMTRDFVKYGRKCQLIKECAKLHCY